MKKIMVGIFAAAMAVSAHALTWGSVSVSTSLSSALSSAKSQGKLLFVVTGTSSCPHCTDLKNAIGALGSQVTDNYVVYYCDNASDPAMMVRGGVPQWGIFDPNTFNPSLKWSNAALYKQLGFSYGSSAVSDAISATLMYVGRSSGSSESTEGGDKSDSGSAAPTDVKLAFYLDMNQIEDFPEEINKKGTILTEFLPTAERPEAVTLTAKQKIVVDEKNATVKYTKRTGLLSIKGGKNYSCLKISYNKKKHTFTGTFKIYTLSAKGVLAKTTVQIKDGKLEGGFGTATAYLKKVGSWPVVLEAVEE